MPIKNHLSRVKIPVWALCLIVVLAMAIWPIFYAIVYDVSVSKPFRDAVLFLNLNTWDWIAIIISFSSLVVASITFISQWQTQKNTVKVTPESQRAILIDHVRHYYRNLVCIYAIDYKLNERFTTHYPSEEHILKLKVDLDSIQHRSAFFNQEEKYNLMEAYFTMIRNYNTEVDVAVKHLSSRYVHPSAKKRDIETLKFKMSFLAQRTLKTLNAAWPDHEQENIKRIYDILNGISEEYNKNNIEASKDALADDRERYFNDRTTAFTEEIFTVASEADNFIFLLNCNIHTEITGKNSRGEDKIFIIPFELES